MDLGSFYGSLAKRAVRHRRGKTGASPYESPGWTDAGYLLTGATSPLATPDEEKARRKGYQQYFGRDFDRLWTRATPRNGR